jgi:membrane associated rhomboid family serine protease
MGAFLVRFPKMKIEMAFFALFFRYRFHAPAYYLLPLWLAMEFFYGSVMGVSSTVAHWAHVGGFLYREWAFPWHKRAILPHAKAYQNGVAKSHSTYVIAFMKWSTKLGSQETLCCGIT